MKNFYYKVKKHSLCFYFDYQIMANGTCVIIQELKDGQVKVTKIKAKIVVGTKMCDEFYEKDGYIYIEFDVKKVAESK